MIKRFFMHVSVLMSMTIFIPSIQAGEPNSQYPDGIVYVVTDGSGTGGSWKNAMGDLNAAVKLASEQSLDVYVAAGTYKGDTTNVNAFIIEEGVNVYGGFAGTETSPSERNLKKNKTILTGQGKQRVLFQSTNFTNKTNSVWDGFVIQDGVSSSDNEKNGIGAYLKDYSALVNCEIKNNVALHSYSRGIGIYMENAVHSTLENCLIHHNESGKNENGRYFGNVRGSAIFFNAGGQVVNSTIVDNTTVDGNTVELLIYDNVTFTNSIIVANRRIGQDGSIYPLSNFNLYGNPLHFVHCAVDGGTNGFSSFPISKSDLNADYSLTQYSSCVDAGIEISHFSDLDITGNKRTQGKRIDIGAIESSWTSTITPSKNNIIYVSEKGKKNGSGSSWEDATCMLQEAVSSAMLTNADVYVAAGTYKGDTTGQNAFTILSGVKVYGGFAGTEKSPSERNLKKNKSILTGQGKQRVLYQTGIFSDSTIAVWDGFVIQDGATRDDDEKFGAGVWLKDYSALVNCEIKENTLLHNSGKGVGVYIYDAEHSRLENCLIHHNGNGIGANGKYVSGRGTAIYAVGGNIINCTIVDNVSIDNAKAVEVEESRKFNLINSIICNNKNINVYEGSVNVGNLSISYPDKAVVRNCAIGDAYGHGNISIYPSELTSDYALNSYSSCVDAGFDIERLSETDLYGNKRVQGKGIDIGAVESSVTCVIKPSKNNIIYVSAKGDADATGESWDKATSLLQSAINIAGRTHADVYVAAGTYYGDTLGQNAFTMIEGVNVYGGFAGTETSPSERDLKKNKTILSGQGKQRVLRQMSHFTDSTMTVWDGFVIQDGSTRPNEMSNGIGAWLMDYSALVNCEIKDNLAYKNIFGFGVYINDAPHSRLENCLIHHNGPALNTNNEFVCSGGGTAVGFSGSGNMINCTVTDNESYNTDAAVDIRNRGVVNIVNSIIVGNKNFTGSKSPKTPKNITVSGNSVLKSSHCAIDGTYSGEGNISINASDLNTDYSLKSISSCIDAGENVDLLDSMDIYGNKRVQGKSIDIGAIESSWSRVITPSANNIIYVSENGKETATGSSWEDATNLLQTAINVASRTGADVYVTAGTYKGDTASVYAFVMGEGVNVYGGFTGTETSPSERNLKLNKSVLTGQNKQHVLCQKTNFTDSTFSVWDGFVIRDGRTRSRDDNRGVGVWMKENSALINCEITNNTVLYSGNCGGGVYIDQAENSRIENCIFHHNYDYGGWLFGGYGCALYVEKGGKMINCTIVDNISRSGSYIIELGPNGMFEIANTIIYGNKNYELGSLVPPKNISKCNTNRVKISHCAFESGDNRNLNLEEAPGTILLASTNNGKDSTLNYVRFINPIAQDYSLHSTSPCVNSGVDSVVSHKTDILSNNRIYQTVDMGAIEWDGNYVSMQTYGQTICNGTATKVEDFDKVADQFKWTLSSNEGVEGFVESGMDSIPSMTLVNNANDTLRLIYSVLPIIDGNEQGSFDYEFAVLPTRKIGNIVITNPKDSQVVDKVNIEFDWYNVNNAKSYTVSLADTSGNWTTIADGITQSYYKYHLDNFTSYKWAITASNECVSATSDTINFSVNDTSYILFNKEKVHLVTDFKAADSIEVHVEGNQLSDGIAFKWAGNDSTMFSYKTVGDWDKINGGTVRVVFHPTIEQSDYEAKLVAFSGKASDTLTVLGAIPNHYNFTIATQKKSYTTSDTVKLHGKVTDMFGNPVNVKELDLYITSNDVDYRRSYEIATDEKGEFDYEFIPRYSESGNYSYGVCLRGDKGTEPMGSFDIVGLKIKAVEEWTVIEGDSISGFIQVQNNSRFTSLSDINVEIVSVPKECQVVFERTDSLFAGTTANIKYKVYGKSVSRNTEKCTFRLTSAEGASMKFTTYFRCISKKGLLTTDPKKIETTMTIGSSKTIGILLRNEGTATTGEISVSLPDFDWMSIQNEGKLPAIPAGDSAMLYLDLRPDADFKPSVQITGTIAFNCDSAAPAVLPYEIVSTSEKKGSIKLEVIDEYYYASEEHPHVDGAEVLLRKKFSNDTIVYFITNADSIHYKYDSIPEGEYLLTVHADHHREYKEYVSINAGRELNKVVIINYQPVTYTWEVVRTEVEDEYQMDLKVSFETNVPVPSVTMNTDRELPELEDLEDGEEFKFSLIITNHGLIAAKDVKVNMPEMTGYEMVALFDEIDSLPAKSTQIVPAVLRKKPNSLRSAGDNCNFAIRLIFAYLCGDIYNYGNAYFNLPWRCEGHKPSEVHGSGSYSVATGGTASYINLCDCFLGSSVGFQTFLSALSCVSDIVGAVAPEFSPITTWVSRGAYGLSILASRDLTPNEQAFNGLTGWMPFSGCFSLFFDPSCLFPSAGSGSPLRSKSTLMSYALPKTSVKTDRELLRQSILDVYVFNQILENRRKIFIEYFNIDDAWNKKGFTPFYETIQPDLIEGREIDWETIKDIPVEEISLDEMLKMTTYYNKTLEAWGKGDYEPSELGNHNKVVTYLDSIQQSLDYIEYRGYREDPMQMLLDAKEVLEKEKNRTQSGACANVKLLISQTMTMTREAFDGTLTITNNLESPLNAVDMQIEILDENGNNANDLFQINVKSLSNLIGINGEDDLDALKTGTAVFQFIPTKEAAPTEPKKYAFGGTFSYVDSETGNTIKNSLAPVWMTVNPCPNLEIDYFMQRDILGDDALTKDRVEPTIPAALGVMVNNIGAGEAKNVTLSTAQPKIIDNEKGLLIDFKFIGSSLNGKDCNLGSEMINFGNIAPKKSSVGVWWLTSSLMGHFVEYEANVTHKTSYGNSRLSLIDTVRIHELIHVVKEYGKNADNVPDFLVNDLNDVYNTPDAIYFSDGTTAQVKEATEASIEGKLTKTDTTVVLTVNHSETGWNYASLSDPSSNKFEICNIIRLSDQREIPTQNVWQTHVTLESGSDPVYEDILHFVDTFSNVGPEDYLLTFRMKTNTLDVIRIDSIPEALAENPVTHITVTFNEAIQDSTFDYNDITLIHQGAFIDLDSTVTVKKKSETKYEVDLSAFTKNTGYYELTVNTSKIKNADGYEGYYGKSASWIQKIDQINVFTDTTLTINGNDVTLRGHIEGDAEIKAKGFVVYKEGDTLKTEHICDTSDSIFALTISLAEGTYEYIAFAETGKTRVTGDAVRFTIDDLTTIKFKESEDMPNAYPNPMEDLLYVDLPNDANLLRILSVDGKTIYESECKGTNMLINVSSLKQGVYILEVTNEAGEVWMKKMLKK
ncbi:MAG: DUF1565 domain-containing protein [Paludibacteraceae bacterium]|nr:DUF1565 domain-containing protein [Paludibacteraceae bacterium]